MRDVIIMQKILLFLLTTLLFTGCTERGQNLRPAPVHTAPIKIKPIQKISKVKPIHFEKSKIVPSPTLSHCLKDTISPKKTFINIHRPVKVRQVPSVYVKDEPIFPLSDETKNKISGFFIFIIGIIILL